MKKYGFSVISLIILLGVIALGVGGYFIYQETKAPSSEKLRYETEYFTDSDTLDNFRLVAYDSAGDKEIIFPSLREKNLGLSSDSFLTLFEYSFPKSGNYLFFREGHPNSDAPWGGIVSYNIKTGKFIRLEYPKGEISSLSPDGIMALAISTDGKNLYLVDLSNNKYRLLLSLAGRETFIYDIPECCGQTEYKVKWIDDGTIEYGVFDGSRPIFDSSTRTFYGPHDLIEYRRVDITKTNTGWISGGA